MYVRPLLITILLSATACAGGLSQLQTFIGQSQTFSAEFDQTVTQQSGRKQQQASGSLSISRPGKFNWQYVKPYQQSIIGDGSKLWVYDPDLNQVTTKSQSNALGSSPAALLAGSNDLQARYDLTEQADQDGLQWVQAKPKRKAANGESAFEQIRIGLKDNRIAAMELQDNFGQRTVIRFAKVTVGVKIAPERFTFTPPKGVDIVNGD
ncbi:outer membrane lipoprotein chaperone LolA [Burkholderiaceae bacterium DAT-1]|nr:outer membrane lipoprotein chaperone LolA [Burkholderiaceae bacterium DAT-1]